MNIPMDSSRTLLAMGPVAPRIKDRQTGEIATDRDGVAQYEVQLVMPMEGAQALPMAVSVPETGLTSDDINIGTLVRATGLIASTGVSKFGKEYVMFRATALSVVKG